MTEQKRRVVLSADFRTDHETIAGLFEDFGGVEKPTNIMVCGQIYGYEAELTPEQAENMKTAIDRINREKGAANTFHFECD